MKCAWRPNGPGTSIEYDLTPVQNGPDIEVNAAAGDNSKFFLRICAMPERRCTKTECPDCTVTNPAGVNTWSAPGQDSCAAIGTLSSAQWSLQDPTKPAGGVQIQYSGGDSAGSGPRSATVVFKCSGDGSPRGVSAVESPPLHYTITIAASAACANTCANCLSWGWWSIILGGVSMILYVGGGIAYNVRVRGEEGLGVIPQWQYWQQLPGLVYDGTVFFVAKSKVAWHGGRRGAREWWQNRGSKELREPIAAAAEG